jgi:putative transposase
MAKRPRRSVPGQIVLRLIRVVLQFVAAACQSRAKLAAENLFLRKQLAMYLERQVKPGRPDDATRITLVILSRLLDWPRLLTIVKPDTLIAWHRQGFRLVWRWKSRAVGRPRIPERLQRLIADVATANPTWGEERIAAELLVKLGLRLSPRTVRRYMPRRASPRGRRQLQTWTTFVKNHAHVTLACDFFVTITATFRVLYVLSLN